MKAVFTGTMSKTVHNKLPCCTIQSDRQVKLFKSGGELT